MSGAASLLGGIDPTYLPGYVPDNRDSYTFALNVSSAAPNVQQVAGVVVVGTSWGLFADEINKFLWWPLHLSGYALLLTPLPLFIGLHLLRATHTSVSLAVAWLPGALAGAAALVFTFRSWSRIDTYGGV